MPYKLTCEDPLVFDEEAQVIKDQDKIIGNKFLPHILLVLIIVIGFKSATSINMPNILLLIL